MSSSESSRRIDIGEDKRVKERVVMGRVGKVNRERMRDFYSRRRGDARKLLIIPPTRCLVCLRNCYICKRQKGINRQTSLFGRTLTYNLISH